jgi:hypothetical protein
VNLPLPSTPSSASVSFTGHPEAGNPAAHAGDSNAKTPFADLLAGASRPAESNPTALSDTGTGSPKATSGRRTAAGKQNRPGTRSAPPDAAASQTTQAADPAANPGWGPGKPNAVPTLQVDGIAMQQGLAIDAASVPECDALASESCFAIPQVLAAGAGPSLGDDVLSPKPGTATSDSSVRAQLIAPEALSIVSDSPGGPVSPSAVANPIVGAPAAATTENSSTGQASPAGAVSKGSNAVLKSVSALATADPTSHVVIGTPDPATQPPAAQHSSGLQLEPGRADRTAESAPPSVPVGPSPAVTVEEIAGSPGRQTPGQATAASGGASFSKSDTSLATDNKQLKLYCRSVGIAGADHPVDMRKPAETFGPMAVERTAGAGMPADALLASAPISVITTAAVSASSPGSPAASTQHAVAAVEATMDVMERMRDASHSSVELKLTFADNTPLTVRVELHEGTVLTTFRTDSAELRQALASEWRQSAPSDFVTDPDRSLRIAEPVFAPASGSTGFTGTATGGHANSRQTPDPTASESTLLSSASARSRGTSPASSAPAAPTRHSTSLRLNAFA